MWIISRDAHAQRTRLIHANRFGELITREWRNRIDRFITSTGAKLIIDYAYRDTYRAMRECHEINRLIVELQK